MKSYGTWKDVTDSLRRITPFGRVVIAGCIAVELYAAIVFSMDYFHRLLP